MKHSSRRRRAPKHREGAVLLIVLLILLMATTTATFAVQNAAFEGRAAEAMHQQVRTKYVSESFAMSGLATFEDPTGAELKASGSNYDDVRTKYGLAMYPTSSDSRDQWMYEFDDTRFQAFNDVDGDGERNDIAPSDTVLSGGARNPVHGTRFNVLVEEWKLLSRKRCRFVATAYGELFLDTARVPGLTEVFDGDAPEGPNVRGLHESVSVSKFYYEKDCGGP